jgi:hypothetical protein
LRHKGEEPLLDGDELRAACVREMQLFAEREEFAFREIYVISVFILDREFIVEGEYLLLDIEFHDFSS